MATCNSIVVGQPYSSCFDIASATGVSVNNLTTWNTDLNCNKLQSGQRICVSAGLITGPSSDGSCSAYQVVAGDSCDTIGLNFGTDAATLEAWNKETFNWKGCSNLDVGLNICVSPGTPPLILAESSATCGPESSRNVTCAHEQHAFLKLAKRQTGTPCTDATAWAQDRVAKLWSEKYTPYSSSGGCGCFSDSDALWHDVVNIEAIANYMIQTGTTDFESDLKSSYVSFTLDSNKLFTTDDFNGSHDDSLWTAILYMIIGDFQEQLGDPIDAYWQAALVLVDWVGESTGHIPPNSGAECDGGVWWVHDGNDTDGYKNAITNALFIQAAARASIKGKGSKYLDLATAAWEFSVRMRNPADGLYADGTRGTDCHRDGTKWTYNQGAMVAALGALYKATNDNSYIEEALITIDGVIAHMSKDGIFREGCDIEGDTCNFDQVGFKGLAVRHFSYFFDFINDASVSGRYSDWIGAQAKAINENAHDAAGNVLSVWADKDSARSQKDNGPHLQRSALDAILASMKYGTC